MMKQAFPRMAARCALSGLLLPNPCCGEIPDNAPGLPILFLAEDTQNILPMLQ